MLSGPTPPSAQTIASGGRTVSQALKQLRTRRGFRSAEGARQMRVSLRYCRRFETGELGLI